jgi:hypothetical protein
MLLYANPSYNDGKFKIDGTQQQGKAFLQNEPITNCKPNKMNTILTAKRTRFYRCRFAWEDFLTGILIGTSREGWSAKKRPAPGDRITGRGAKGLSTIG